MTDCDDSNQSICMGDELCNGESDDCDEEIDEDAIDLTTWYVDNVKMALEYLHRRIFVRHPMAMLLKWEIVMTLMIRSIQMNPRFAMI